MIVLYRKDKDDAWKGYLKNILVEPIEEQEEKITSTFIIIPEAKTKYKKDRVRLLYNNTELEGYGANQGDELVINPIGGVPFWIDGKEFWWIRNVDVYAVAI